MNRSVDQHWVGRRSVPVGHGQGDSRRSVPVSRLARSFVTRTQRSKTVAGFHGEPKEEAGARRMSGGEFHELDYTKHVREMLERSGRMLEINEENQQRRLREQPAGIDEYKTKLNRECDEIFSRYTLLDPGSVSAAAREAEDKLETSDLDEGAKQMPTEMAKYDMLIGKTRLSDTEMSVHETGTTLPSVRFGTSLSFKKHRQERNPNGMRDLQVGIDVVKAYSIIHLRSVISTISKKSEESHQQDYERLRKYIQKIKSATVLKHFTILGMFGTRQLAETRHCRHNETGIHVAIDFMKKSELEEMHLGEKISRQLMLLKDLRHPNVVELIGVVDTKNLILQVMEPLYGGHITTLLCQQRRFCFHTSRFYIAQVISAVDYVHSCGVVHRDVNPANLVLNHLGNLKLTSFSCAKKTFGRRSNSMAGSPQYQAPEMVRGELYGFTVDWWGIGCCAFEFATGDPPFVEENRQLLYEMILELKYRIPRFVDKQTKSLIKGLLIRHQDRLGCTHGGLEHVKQHVYFRNFDWEALREGRIEPPIKTSILQGDLWVHDVVKEKEIKSILTSEDASN